MKKQNVLVCIDKKSSSMEKASDSLAKAGLEVVDVLKVSGVISGIVDETKIPELRKVEGVSSVEVDQEYASQ